eukprot:CAMPEP_0194496104 /NCGR_PEP_ID=MMETSP0253-20130528/13487_1 /TAXON_ID=2966 /ORGANISM="Noctiluca scintillans" /LENGTH=172 /DNA_ID=CAMNT_0039337457 /DNA_START=352 /DNA_END=868 /DNA_ORIENTATION=-
MVGLSTDGEAKRYLDLECWVIQPPRELHTFSLLLDLHWVVDSHKPPWRTHAKAVIYLVWVVLEFLAMRWRDDHPDKTSTRHSSRQASQPCSNPRGILARLINVLEGSGSVLPGIRLRASQNVYRGFNPADCLVQGLSIKFATLSHDWRPISPMASAPLRKSLKLSHDWRPIS